MIVKEHIYTMSLIGASDDAVSCCLMLETLQVLSREEKPLEHNIIFLFNSAEENILHTVSTCLHRGFVAVGCVRTR